MNIFLVYRNFCIIGKGFWIFFWFTGTFVLSVKDYDPNRGATVKHYKVLKTSDDTQYYISEKFMFPSLPELVSHYKGNAIVIVKIVWFICIYLFEFWR